MGQNEKPTNKKWMIVAVFAAILIFPIGFFWSHLNWSYLGSCIAIIFLMVSFLLFIGKAVTDRFSGILIDEKCYMTLSRFQLVIWTIIVLSAFLTIALGRVYALLTNPSLVEFEPLSIELPAQLWALLGIGTTSLVGSPLILNTKKDKTPKNAIFIREKEAYINDKIKDDPKLIAANNKIENLPTNANTQDYRNAVKERDTIKANLSSECENEANKHIDAEFKRFGLLAYKRDINDAEFSDMFKGDEQGNKKFIDMAKVQLFFFTLIIAFTYMIMLLSLIHNTASMDAIDSFPALNDGLVALLGISHVGFLGNEIPDHT